MKHNKDTQPNQCDTKPGDPDETFLETDPQPSPKGGRRECPFDPRSLPLALAHVTAACKSLEEGGGTGCRLATKPGAGVRGPRNTGKRP